MKQLKRPALAAIVLTTIFSCIWVSLSLTPSHYAVALQQLGVDVQPLLNAARPIRSDDWAAFTPLIQQTVLNNFQRYSEIGISREDLRGFWGLPLKDWALIFKPYYWGFFVLPAANAFSFYYLFMGLAFTAGFTIYLSLLAIPTIHALLIALILLFSHHNQVWWGSNAACLALTVWIPIPLLLKRNWVTTLLSAFFVTASALLGQLYPAWQISQLFIFLGLILALRPDIIQVKRVLAWVVGTALGAGITYAYLRNVIPIMANTIYPGQQFVPSGGESPLRMAYNLFPFISSSADFEIAIGMIASNTNICAQGTVTSWLPLFCLCFLDFRKLRLERVIKAKTLIIAGVTAVLLLRMYAARTLGIEYLFLLNKVSHYRGLLALGTLFTIIAYLGLNSRKLIFNNRRLLIFVGFGVFYQLILAHRFSIDLDIFDYSFLLLSIFSLCRITFPSVRSFSQKKAVTVVLFLSFLINFAAFSRFNAIQAADEIFSAKRIQNVANFVEKTFPIQDNPVVGVEGFRGGVLTGLGLPTPAHVYKAPDLQDARDRYRGVISDEDINRIFNRYHHTLPRLDRLVPRLKQDDLVEVPLWAYSRIVDEATDVSPLNRSTCRSAATPVVSPRTTIDSENQRQMLIYELSDVDLPQVWSAQSSASLNTVVDTAVDYIASVRTMFFLDYEDVNRLINADGTTLPDAKVLVFVESLSPEKPDIWVTSSSGRCHHLSAG